MKQIMRWCAGALLGVLLVSTVGAAEPLSAKLDRLIIPKLSFRQATLKEVIDYVEEQSRKVDPEGVGVKILLKLPEGSQKGTLTFDMRRISVRDVLKYLAEVADVRFRIESGAVVLEPPVRNRES